jgi:hypothetical protein
MANSKTITKPNSSEYPEWFAEEIELVHYNDLIGGLSETLEISLSILKPLSDEKLNYCYEDGKWTIKEIWQHIIDTERVLAYRALRYARNDKTILQGFDHIQYTIESKTKFRPWNETLDEYVALRNSSIHLFKSFDEKMLLNKGTAGRSELTVRAVGYLILGHNIHHLNTINEKYLL